MVLFVSASGHKEKPVVIWKYDKPRSLKRSRKLNYLLITAGKKNLGWMGDYESDLNSRLSNTNRKIVLLLGKAGCHPDELKGQFSNIALCFLPLNTTSKL